MRFLPTLLGERSLQLLRTLSYYVLPIDRRTSFSTCRRLALIHIRLLSLKEAFHAQLLRTDLDAVNSEFSFLISNGEVMLFLHDLIALDFPILVFHQLHYGIVYLRWGFCYEENNLFLPIPLFVVNLLVKDI